MKIHERPCASKGLTSYRCKTIYGWVMIGARDHDDAMNEAKQSSSFAKRENLEVWDGSRYISC